MGFFSNITEKSKEINENRVKQFLLVNEQVEYISPNPDEFVVLTNKRIIFADARIFKNESGIVSIPYSKINKIAIAKKSAFSTNDKIEITTLSDKHELVFLKDGLEFYNKLAEHICG